MTSKEVLAKMVASKALSKDGRDWITLALDPFHDYNHQIAGYPDSDASQTVVACYEYQYQLAAPAGAPANWDAHVFNTPLMMTDALKIGTMNAGWFSFIQDAADTSVVMGPLTIYASAAGGLLYPTGTAKPTTEVALPSGASATDLNFGISRIIGQGFEVVNTTAPINQQGSVTVYRMPSNPGRYTINTQNTAGTVKGLLSGVQHRSPPSSVQEALLLKGTSTWAAADGVYAVPALSTVANPLLNNTNDGFLTTGASVGVAGAAAQSAWGVTAANAAPALTGMVPTAKKTTPFDVTGAFFSGLSNSTTLQITYKVYVERAPTQAESNLAVVASPSAAYDMVALELYSHAISQLPVAVRVSENAAGDWWRSVLKVVSQIAMPLSMGLAPWLPGAPMVGALVANTSKAALGTLASKPRSSKEQIQVSTGQQPKKKENPLTRMKARMAKGK